MVCLLPNGQLCQSGFKKFEEHGQMTEIHQLELKHELKYSLEEFFEGYSIPRNQEMMRIFKDLDLVEHLGSGIPRVLEKYGKDCFRFTENFTRMTFPNAWDLSEDEEMIGVGTEQPTEQVMNLIKVLEHISTHQEFLLWIKQENGCNYFRADPVLRLRFAVIPVRQSPPCPLAKGDLLNWCMAAEFSPFNLDQDPSVRCRGGIHPYPGS